MKKLIILTICSLFFMSMAVLFGACNNADSKEKEHTVHNYVDGVCSVCGDELKLIKTWDVSANTVGNVTAYLYASEADSDYCILDIIGTGGIKNKLSEEPWFTDYYRAKIKEAVMHEGVTSIGDYTFYNFFTLKKIIIPDSVTGIGNYAFKNCSSLDSVIIPDSVTSIGYEAFSNCSSLASVIFKNTQGWKAGSTSIASDKLADPATAAQYLKSTYYNFTWTRQ